jgi:Tfp pilus assembly protein PilF
MNRSPRHLWLVGSLLLAATLTACGNAQSRKQSYIAHGKEYFAAANYDKARVEFTNAAQIDPKDANIRYLLGQVAEKLGDARTAVGQYQAAINQDPANSGARAALARIYLFAGLADKAMELVAPGLSADPNNAQLLTVRGGARAQLGDPTDALTDAQRAVQLASSDDYAIALLASLYRQRSQIGEAISVVQTGLQRLPNDVDLRVVLADLEVTRQDAAAAEAQLKQIIAIEPRVLLDRYRLARFYIQQKNVDAAEKTLRDAVQGFPANSDAKLQLVNFLASQRGHAAALSQIDAFIAAEPNNDSLRLTLGEYLAQLGEGDRAERSYRAIIARGDDKDANALKARDRLAALLVGKNKSDEAATQIAVVLQQNPRDNDALIVRSNISISHGDLSGAITDLRAVLRDQPNAVSVMRVLAQAYEQNGETGLAEETLRTAVQISPKDAQSRFELAQILIGAGKPDQAQALLDQLSKERPTDASVQESLFRAQAAQKLDDQARATALNIQRIGPDQALGHYLEGLLDETENKVPAARKDYETALKLQSDANQPLEALTRLDVTAHNPQAALERIDSVLAKHAANPTALILKAEVLSSERQSAPAEAAFRQTIQTVPAWARGYYELAMVQLQQNHGDEAVRTLLQGLAQIPGDRRLVDTLGTVYERLGRPNDAISLYQDLLNRSPSTVFAANNLAMLLVTYRSDTASLAQAQKLADQLATTDVPTVIDTRGWVKFKSGDFHGAESLLQEAVDKSPNAPELRYHLAMAQLRSGESQAAQQNLESALQSTRSFDGIDDARARLAQLRKTGVSG